MLKQVLRLSWVVGFWVVCCNALGQVPTMSGFTPTFGPPGTLVTISGSNFNANPANMAVFVGRVRATIVSGTTTQLQVRVPLGAVSVEYIHVMDLTTNRGVLSWSCPTQQFTITNSTQTVITSGYFSQWIVPVGITARGPLATDFNNDGRTDIVASISGQASIFLQDSCGFITQQINLGDASSAPQIGDFNQDGRQDLVLGGSTLGGISILTRRSDNTGFNPRVFLGNPTSGSLVRGWIADVNSDGLMDLISNNTLVSSNAYWLQTGPGLTFSTGVSNTVGSAFNPGILGNKPADMNRDGRIDIVSCPFDGSTTNISINQGASPYFTSSIVNIPGHSNAANIELADLDRNGTLDLITTDFSSGLLDVSLLQCNSCVSPTVISNQVYSGISSPLDVVSGDLNGDGWIDIVVTNRSSLFISIFINDQTGHFSRQDISTPSNPFELDIADVNGDGYMDILVGLGLTTDVFILLGNNAPVPAPGGALLKLAAGTQNPNTTNSCISDTLKATYTTQCAFSSGNQFVLELSNSSGSFASPLTIATTSGLSSGSLQGPVPLGLLAGSLYRLRIRSTNPVVVAQSNAFTISQDPNLLMATVDPSPSQICPGTTVSSSYGLTGCLLTGATVQLQLSDATGSFSAPTVLSVRNLNFPANPSTGTISGLVPSGLPAGGGYRVRVRWVETGLTSADNGVDLSVPALAVAPAKPTATGLRCPSVSPLAISTAGAASAVSYQWQLVQGTGSFTGPTNTTTVTFVPDALSIYPLVFRARAVGVCGDVSAASDTVTVHSPQSIGLFTASVLAPVGTQCQPLNSSVTLLGSLVGISYDILVNGVSRTTVAGTGGNITVPLQAAWLMSGTNSVNAIASVGTVTGVCSLAVQASPATFIWEPTVVAATANAAAVCLRDSGYVQLGSVQANATYRLLQSGIPVPAPLVRRYGNRLHISPSLLAPPATAFEVEASSIAGCGVPVLTPVSILVEDSATIGGLTANYIDAEIYAGRTPVQFDVAGASGVGTYLWDFGDGGVSTLPNPTYVFNKGGTYTVTLTASAANGCPPSRKTLKVLVVLDAIYIPNVFTPNGDGVNDFFTISLPPIERYELFIHDRWGREVHQSKSLDPGWNGRTEGGSDCQAGSYAYVLKAWLLAGVLVERRGMVTILR